MESWSRFLPLPTYRDPHYDSDSSFENYYLNYAEEQNPSPHRAEHDHEEIDSKTSKNKLLDNTTTIGPHKIPARKKRFAKKNPARSCVEQIRAASNNSPSPQSTVTEVVGPGWAGPVLFTMRVLQRSDMNKKQQRLSLPCKQVVAKPDSIFTEDESSMLGKGEPIWAKLVDPRGVEHEVKVRWTMAGPTSYCYAIGKPWMGIVEENGFRPGMVVEVWANRRGEKGELWFILERVK